MNEPDERRDILEDFKENYGKPGKKSGFFMKKYNMSFGRVHYIAGRLGLTNKRKTTWEEIKPLAIKEYEDGGRIDWIAAKYRIGEKIMTKWVKDENLLRGIGSKWLYKCNEDYFEKLDSPEKAYWLGFIAADGYLHDKKLGMSLQKKDKSHLELLCKCLDADFKLFPFRNAFQLWVGRKKIYYDLKKLGLSERKTPTLNGDIFDFVPDKYKMAFCHGYFDGDGCVILNKNRVRKDGSMAVYFSLIGNKPFLERYSLEIERFTGVKTGKISFAKRTRHSFIFNKYLGDKEIISIYEAFFLSPNSSKCFLERKRIRLYQRYERSITTI